MPTCRVNRTKQTNRRNDSVTATIFIYYILFNNMYFMYYFHVLYNIQSRITCIWSRNYMHFQFNIYYNSILCLYIWIPRGSVYTMGDQFVYSPRIRSTGVFGPGDRFIGPLDCFR